MLIQKHINLFISGGLTDTGDDVQKLQQLLKDAGFEANVKYNEDGSTTEELIIKCDYFICVIGIVESCIRTPFGDTLPQLELNYAIRNKKPVIAFIKHSLERGNSKKQEFFRNLLKKQLGKQAINYDNISQLHCKVVELLQNGIDSYAKKIRPYKIFICHSTKDKKVVDKINERLNEIGISTFYDKHNIRVGYSLDKTIRQAITQVGYVAICLSKNALKSDWIHKEIAWALENEEHFALDGIPFFLPIRLDNFNWPKELKFLSDIRCADISIDFENGIDSLISTILEPE